MSEEKKLKQAQAVYATLCEAMDEHDWHYKKDEERLTIECGAQGEDLPIELRLEVDAERELILLLSQMPFTVAENRRTALAVAVSQANNGLADGNFDYDYLSGRIIFRLTSSYIGSLIGKELFNYMLLCACVTVDRYNDKFLMVAKSAMSNEEILDFIE